MFPGTGESKAPGSKKRVTLPALSLHLTALVSQYHLFIESTRDMLRADGAPTAAPLTSQQGPVPVCSEPHMLQGSPGCLKCLLGSSHSKPAPRAGRLGPCQSLWPLEPLSAAPANGILQHCCTRAQQFHTHWLWGKFASTEPVQQRPTAWALGYC